MAKETVWMPLYWGDYLASTAHLSTEEHGAYLLLIGAYWQAGGPLVDDDRRLARITRLSLRRWKVVRETLVEFFTIRAQKWHLKRIDDELSETKKRYLNRSESGKKGRALQIKNQQNQHQNSGTARASPGCRPGIAGASPQPQPQKKKEEQVCSSQKETTLDWQKEKNHDPQPNKDQRPKNQRHTASARLAT